MRILLTGGSGFVGRNLREALRHEHDVIAPSHQELDVTDAARVDEVLAGNRFDVVLHAAIEGGAHVVESTLRGYWNLARRREAFGRLFYFGSGAEYGKHRDLVKVREEEIGREIPRDPYGFAKLLCHEHARQTHGITNLRLFGVYGPHEGYIARFISNSIVKVLLGIDVTLRQNVVFDYLHVNDLVAVVRELLAVNHAPSDLNLTPTESISLLRILEIIASASGREVRPRILSDGLNFAYTGDNGRLLHVLPDARFTSYADGIGALYAWYKVRQGEIDRAAVLRDEFLDRSRARTPLDASGG